ncbi:unnamed protein product [Mesocestoides corti]|uniref:C2 domain-containing protein n=2 Tax=Mesocestoides corti TaxID=53468 RepID=A0A158QVA9_MESCO|nr:unnamed protein product [Mesocestoides corti]
MRCTFKAPLILNIHVKFDERKQVLDVFIRNLQNAPERQKVRVVTKLTIHQDQLQPNWKCTLKLRNKSCCSKTKSTCHSTTLKRGANPHFNENFCFKNVIASDVRYGMLSFDILGKKKKGNEPFLGTVYLPGSEIQLDYDTAYSLSVTIITSNIISIKHFTTSIIDGLYIVFFHVIFVIFDVVNVVVFVIAFKRRVDRSGIFGARKNSFNHTIDIIDC